MKSVGWGIIGCGDVVDRKAGDAFQTIPRSRLVAVMRRSEDKLRDFARRRGVEFWTTDAQAVIKHAGVDIVYVATPPGSHCELTLRVCAHGKPAYVEKPMARKKTSKRTPRKTSGRTHRSIRKTVRGRKNNFDELKLVVDLMGIPGRSREEGQVADFVRHKLRQAGALKKDILSDAAHQ